MIIRQEGFVLLTTTILLLIITITIMDIWQLVGIESKLSSRYWRQCSVVVITNDRASGDNI